MHDTLSHDKLWTVNLSESGKSEGMYSVGGQLHKFMFDAFADELEQDSVLGDDEAAIGVESEVDALFQEFIDQLETDSVWAEEELADLEHDEGLQDIVGNLLDLLAAWIEQDEDTEGPEEIAVCAAVTGSQLHMRA